MGSLIYKEESYKIIDICMEGHRKLGKVFSKIVYGDALEIEFTDNNINYKGNLLPHKYKTDFIIDDKIVLKVKPISSLTSSHIKQKLNYLAVSKLRLGLLINFGKDSLMYKIIVL